MQARVKDNAEDLSDRARNFGTAAWERTKMGYAAAQEKVLAGAKKTDRYIHKNPYQSIGIALGVGLLLGFLIRRAK